MKCKSTTITWAAAIFLTLVIGCSHNPHKAEKIDTKVNNASAVRDEQVGVKDGNMVVQRKIEMSEELRRLQNEVYEMEDKVFGSSRFGSQGMHGVLKKCRMDLSRKEYGGDGKLTWNEPLERITDKEEELKMGLDEKNNLVGVSEEFIKDRISRFQNYKRVLLKRDEEYRDKIDICKAELDSKKFEIEKKKKAAATGGASGE
jgi:hypothetical protein